MSTEKGKKVLERIRRTKKPLSSSKAKLIYEDHFGIHSISFDEEKKLGKVC